MTEAAMAPDCRSLLLGRRRCWGVAGPLLLLAGVCASAVETPPGAPHPGARVAAETGPSWQDLTPPQQDFLQPLQRHWPTIDALQKRKWMALTARVPTMSVDERTRIRTRMTDWATLTPEQRGQARLRYQEAREASPQDRQARWEAYQSLPPERRQQLAARAASAAASRKVPAGAGSPPAAARDQPQAKSNIVTPSGLEAQRRHVGPALVQARPGATTTLVSRPALPPLHQQTGMPKIAATPEFVNKSTLLPRHGPQAVSVPSSTASGVAERVRR